MPRRLQERTATLHRQAERSGFIRTMLQGRASRDGYALFLRNLLPAYQALEQGLERGRSDPGVGRWPSRRFTAPRRSSGI